MASYTVQSGDTLSAIAAANGVTVADLVEANGIKNPNLIQVGQQLVIPKKPISPAAAEQPPPLMCEIEAGFQSEAPSEVVQSCPYSEPRFSFPSVAAANQSPLLNQCDVDGSYLKSLITNTVDNATDEEHQTAGVVGITEDDLKDAAKTLGVELCAVKAIAKVETKGDPFLSDGRPKILYERHYFHQLTNGAHDGNPDLSHSTGFSKYGTYSKQHERLEAARKLDESAAIQSVSWGRFQIMGSNYAMCGYETPQAFEAAMRESEKAQLDAFVSFVKSKADGKLHTALKSKDWNNVAYYYNGSNYAKNAYHTKMKDEYEACDASN